MSCMFLFFFQAEDGIRDYKVTGVQTCALPISAAPDSTLRGIPFAILRAYSFRVGGVAIVAAELGRTSSSEIGRASCRERVEISVGVESRIKKRWRRATMTTK